MNRIKIEQLCESCNIYADIIEGEYPDYLGIGFQWDITDTFVYSKKQKENLYKLINQFRPPIIRCLYRAGIYADGEGNMDFNRPKFKELTEILDYCQENNIEVMLGEWDRDTKVSIIKASDDPKWAQLIAASLKHLVLERGYNCIKYYNYVNEPNGEWAIDEGRDNWQIWAAGVANLYDEISKEGLLEHLTIAGPDSTFADSWVDRCADNFPERLGCYEFHKYAWFNEVLDGSVERIIKQKRDYIYAKDANAKDKPYLMGEAGLIDGKNSKDQQKNVATFEYGLFMSDYIIQSIRGGQNGVILWMLDDCMHDAPNTPPNSRQYKEWGLFSSLEDKPRSWFYPMMKLSHLFPKGARILLPKTQGDIRVVMCEKDGKRTVAVMNNSYSSKNIQMSGLGLKNIIISAYTPYIKMMETERLEKGREITVELCCKSFLLIEGDIDEI